MSNSPFTEKFKPFSKRSPQITSPTFKSYIPDFLFLHSDHPNVSPSYHCMDLSQKYLATKKMLGHMENMSFVSKRDHLTKSTYILTKNSMQKSTNKKLFTKKLRSHFLDIMPKMPIISKSVDDLLNEKEDLYKVSLFSTSEDDLINSFQTFKMNCVSSNNQSNLLYAKDSKSKDYNAIKPNSNLNLSETKLHRPTSLAFEKLGQITNSQNRKTLALPHLTRANINNNTLYTKDPKQLKHFENSHNNKEPIIHNENCHKFLDKQNVINDVITPPKVVSKNRISNESAIKSTNHVNAYVDFSSFYELVNKINFNEDKDSEEYYDDPLYNYENLPNYQDKCDINKKISLLKNAMYLSLYSTN